MKARVEPLLTDNDFTWSLRDRNPYKAYFSKTDTSVMRTLIPVPLVSVIKRFDCTEQYFPMVLFILLYKVVLPFESAGETLKCDHSNESY